MPKTSTQHVSFRCPVDLVEKLDIIAADESRSRGFVVIAIIKDHFHKQATVSSNGNGKKKPAVTTATKKKAGAR